MDRKTFIFKILATVLVAGFAVFILISAVSNSQYVINELEETQIRQESARPLEEKYYLQSLHYYRTELSESIAKIFLSLLSALSIAYLWIKKAAPPLLSKADRDELRSKALADKEEVLAKKKELRLAELESKISKIKGG